MTDAEFDELNAEQVANSIRINELADEETEDFERNGSASMRPEKFKLIRRNMEIMKQLGSHLSARLKVLTDPTPNSFAIDFYSGGLRLIRVVVAATAEEAVQQAQTMTIPRSVNFYRVVQLAGEADGLEIWSEQQ